MQSGWASLEIMIDANGGIGVVKMERAFMLKRVNVKSVVGGIDAPTSEVVLNPKAVTHFCVPVGQVGKTIAHLLGGGDVVGIDEEPSEVGKWYGPGQLREVARRDGPSPFAGQQIWVVVENIKKVVKVGGHVDIKFVDGSDISVRPTTDSGQCVLSELEGSGDA